MITDVQLKKLMSIPQIIHPERLFVSNKIQDTDKVIYDLGCGRHKTVDRAIGVDIKKGTDIRCSIDYLPMLLDKSADVVISRHSLEHLIDPVSALREWYRILKVNGILIIILPDHEFIDTMDFRLSNGKHLHAYTRNSFTNLVQALFPVVVNTDTVIENWSFGAVMRKM